MHPIVLFKLTNNSH